MHCPKCGFNIWVPFNPNYDGVIKEEERGKKKDEAVV
jgi:hypothetical protein